MSGEPYSLGVDLGTAFVAAAVARAGGVRAFPLAEGSPAASAVVHVEDGGIVTLGDRGEQRAAARPDGAVRELRRRLADGGTVVVDGAAYAVTALLGAQLRDVVRRVAQAEGGPPDGVALTVPAEWDDARRAQLVEVAAAAGVAAPSLVTEAEAAVVALGDRVRVGEVVAVHDVGAGFHTALVRRGPRGTEVLGTPAGDESAGGSGFDEAVVGLVRESVAADGDDPFALDPDRLRRDCVRAKETLSVAAEAVVPVALPGRTVEVRLTRARLEERLRGQVEATTWALSRTIASAGLLPSDVGSVVLLGGSSRLPLVTELLVQQFGRPVLTEADPKLPVARGAALLARSAPASAPVRAGAAAAPAGTPDAAGPDGPDSRATGWNGAGLNGAGLNGANGVWPGGDGGAVAPLLDPPTPLLVVPGSSRGFGDADRPWYVRFGLPLAVAGLAVAVLVGVFVVAPGGRSAPVVPAVAPAASSPSPGPATTTPPSAAASTPPSPTASAASSAARSASGTPSATRARTRTPAAPAPRPRATTTAPRSRAAPARPRTSSAPAARPAAAAAFSPDDAPPDAPPADELPPDDAAPDDLP